MPKNLTYLIAAPLLATAALLVGTAPAHAQHGRGGYHGYYHGGYGWYHHGVYPGWYRPYPFIGVGIGVGFYAPYYGSYAYPVAPGVVYPAYPYAPVVVGSAPGGAPSDQAPPQQQPTEKPPPDNAGHFQLMVPANADVYIEGQKIAQTGTTREIVTPPVTPGTRYTYKISVRYTNAQGQPVDDTRDISFQANDWFSIDFTRPAPPRANAPPPNPLR
jgi:uncharacterized protein (TIGR03000 family)